MSVERVRRQCARMRTLVAAGDESLARTAPSISNWSPAEHLDHLTKVSRAIVGRLATPGAERQPKGISLVGRLILTLGWIPRGKGRSPEKMRGAHVGSAELAAAIEELESLLAQLDERLLASTRGPIVPHPRFGGLTPAQALRFVAIHNEHHFRIVEEIRRA